MPLSANELLHAAREHPLALIRQLWLWEWHAFILWAILAAIAIPAIALVLTPILRRLLERVRPTTTRSSPRSECLLRPRVLLNRIAAPHPRRIDHVPQLDRSRRQPLIQ